MARNKFDVDETLESPFSAKHLKRALKYIKKHRFKMLLAFFLSALASVAGLFVPKITQTGMLMSAITPMTRSERFHANAALNCEPAKMTRIATIR